MKSRATEHSKIGHLARRLKIHPVMAVGLMERLWHWAADEIPNGGIGKRADEIIADKCWWPWPKRAKEFVEALTEVGFLDEIDGCGLYIHDWHDHCEDRVHMHLARRFECFANGKTPKLGRLSDSEKQRALQAYRAHGVRTPCAQHAQESAHRAQNGAQHAHAVRMPCALPLACSPLPVATPPTPCVGEESSGDSGEEGDEPHRILRDLIPLGGGDEAHRILRERPELAALSFEQDLKARKDVLGDYPDYDFEGAAPEVADLACKMGHIAHAGSWLSTQYQKLAPTFGRKDEKKDGARNWFRGLA